MVVSYLTMVMSIEGLRFFYVQEFTMSTCDYLLHFQMYVHFWHLDQV